MRHSRSRFGRGLILAPLLLALSVLGSSCSKNSPTSVVTPPVDEVTARPPIPQPGTPYGAIPGYSASTLVLRPYTGDFNPLVSALKGHWKVFVHQMRFVPLTPPCSGAEVLAYEGDGCCHDIPDQTVTVPGCGLLNAQTHTFMCSPSRPPNGGVMSRFATMVNGEIQVPPMYEHGWNTEECLTGTPALCLDDAWWVVHYQVVGRRLQAAPHMLRERFWQRIPMDDHGLLAVWLYGDDTFDVTTTYRTGSDSTSTTSFAKTLKVGAEGTFEWLKVGVEATIQKTYSTSVTISKSQEVSYQKHLVGEPGKVTCHTLWSLVDQYRWSDAGKIPYTDPNYDFAFGGPDERGRPVEFQMSGEDLVLMKTVFTESGALERSEMIALR